MTINKNEKLEIEKNAKPQKNVKIKLVLINLNEILA